MRRSLTTVSDGRFIQQLRESGRTVRHGRQRLERELPDLRECRDCYDDSPGHHDHGAANGDVQHRVEHGDVTNTFATGVMTFDANGNQLGVTTTTGPLTSTTTFSTIATVQVCK